MVILWLGCTAPQRCDSTSGCPFGSLVGCKSAIPTQVCTPTFSPFSDKTVNGQSAKKLLTETHRANTTSFSLSFLLCARETTEVVITFIAGTQSESVSRKASVRVLEGQKRPPIRLFLICLQNIFRQTFIIRWPGLI